LRGRGVVRFAAMRSLRTGGQPQPGPVLLRRLRLLAVNGIGIGLHLQSYVSGLLVDAVDLQVSVTGTNQPYTECIGVYFNSAFANGSFSLRSSDVAVNGAYCTGVMLVQGSGKITDSAVTLNALGGNYEVESVYAQDASLTMTSTDVNLLATYGAAVRIRHYGGAAVIDLLNSRISSTAQYSAANLSTTGAIRAASSMFQGPVLRAANDRYLNSFDAGFNPLP
jgi:hypothetical protein